MTVTYGQNRLVGQIEFDRFRCPVPSVGFARGKT